ncbi:MULTISPECIES: D-alanine--D-alanine ligase family protein [unclassified Actinobaculum]|uniref:D-alanine--D-alanine ligase family protein n=1 Tax=unclassified Actinobaculum TaxID=2609299 RepID=UPI000D5284A5|nr:MULTISPECIES: D-alanine--D-alanine ligase family protein [unclassified Actinobaculum]AWE42205.1 D-alanine--D-alanine ligase A [Actinobaculum sp. 313]RTE50769.1 D-alanine--D-alanine ligase [Actinobaculum sp. 352]
MASKKRVALIYGGVSGEHSVSCLTAASVMRAMDPQKYEILPIGIRKDGTWVPGVQDPAVLEAAGPRGEVAASSGEVLLGKQKDNGVAYSVSTVPSDDAHNASSATTTAQTREVNGALATLGGQQCGPVLSELGRIDVAFPLLHGPFGEDGTIQGMLEMTGIPYVGSGVFASAAGMDKHYMKVVLEAAGLPVAPYVLVTARRWRTERDAILQEVEQRLRYPIFVKPARAGSSLGISRVEDASGLAAAVQLAQETDPKVIIEQGVAGREIECAVLGGHGDESARASVLGEIVLDSQWYDYQTKYIQTEGFHMEIPAAVDDDTAARMRAMAIKVFEAFECEGMTRVDFFLTDEGEIVVNEHNTIPGFTAVSMYPILWQKTGLDYSALIDELITLALERPLGLR